MQKRSLTTTTTPADFLGQYGPSWKTGLISEHADLFRQAGGVIRPGHIRLGWAIVERVAYPVMCSEIVRIDTEDGPVSGRCGNPAEPSGACEFHAVIIAEWEAENDAEEARLSDLDHSDYLASIRD